MAIQTCDVLCKLTDQSGEPVDGVRITARLMSLSVGGGFLRMPDVEYSVTNGRGECTLVLAPNDLNGTSSTYTIEIVYPGSRPRYFKGIHVPNVASITLAELLGSGAPVVSTSPLMVDASAILIGGYSIDFSASAASASFPVSFASGTLQIDGLAIAIT
jgi:hypothetical protein